MIKQNKATLKSLQAQTDAMKGMQPKDIGPSPTGIVVKTNKILTLFKTVSTPFSFIATALIAYGHKLPFVSKIFSFLSIWYGGTSGWKILSLIYLKSRKFFVVFNALIGLLYCIAASGFSYGNLIAGFLALGTTSQPKNSYWSWYDIFWYTGAAILAVGIIYIGNTIFTDNSINVNFNFKSILSEDSIKALALFPITYDKVSRFVGTLVIGSMCLKLIRYVLDNYTIKGVSILIILGILTIIICFIIILIFLYKLLFLIISSKFKGKDYKILPNVVKNELNDMGAIAKSGSYSKYVKFLIYEIVLFSIPLLIWV